MTSHESAPHGILDVHKFTVPQRPAIDTVADARRAHGGDRTFWRKRNRRNFERSLADMERFERRDIFAVGQLFLAKLGLDGRTRDYGLVSCRVVTNTGVAYIVDAFQNLVELENMRYHGIGTGSTAEAATQTALVSELTTAYSTSNTRPTGTLGEQSGNTNVYETTATITVSAASAITEHGLFSQAATGGGVMIDRSVFSAVNLNASESIQATYRLTFPSGS